MGKKEFTLRQLFSIIDGRLSTTMDDVYMLLNFITGQELMTHHLPIAMQWVRSKCPNWYLEAASKIAQSKYEVGSDFKKLMAHPTMDTTIEIEPLDRIDMGGFEWYIIENSLLKKALDDGQVKKD